MGTYKSVITTSPIPDPFEEKLFSTKASLSFLGALPALSSPTPQMIGKIIEEAALSLWQEIFLLIHPSRLSQEKFLVVLTKTLATVSHDHFWAFSLINLVSFYFFLSISFFLLFIFNFFFFSGNITLRKESHSICKCAASHFILIFS